MSIGEFLHLLEIVLWPAVALVAILVVRPYITGLLSGAKVKLSIGGQSIETTLPELRQVFEEQASEPLSGEHVAYLNSLEHGGAKPYPSGVESEERKFLRPLRNSGLILTSPRNSFLQNAKAIELSALGRLYLRARTKAAAMKSST
jgi:hypothetical protein